jgi:hypothetical protein
MTFRLDPADAGCPLFERRRILERRDSQLLGAYVAALCSLHRVPLVVEPELRGQGFAEVHVESLGEANNEVQDVG